MEFKNSTLEEGLGMENIKLDDSSAGTNKLSIGEVSEKGVSKEIQALLALPELDKVIFVSHSMDLRRAEFNPQCLVSFMKTNDLRIENVKDIVYAAIMVKLMSLNIIGVASSRAYPQVMATDIPDSVSSIMDEYASQARTMMVIALHVYSLGNDFDKIPWDTWYESFTKVRGSYLNQERFELIVQLIASSHFFSKVPKLLALDEIVSEHDVLKYKMSRLSSPSLVKKALFAVKHIDELLDFELEKLQEYMMYDEAGVIAEIASGPLSKFCKGKIDPLTAKSWPPETTIYDLKPIKAPYDAHTIIRARMILDAIGFNYGRWYQAEKAMAKINYDDITFKYKAKALLSKVKEPSTSS